MKERFWAGGFLFDPQKNQVLLHKRDSNTKFNPNSWAFFGGLQEGDESPVGCFVRELFEEIGLHVSPENVFHLCDYLNKEFDTYRHVFYVESNIRINELKLGEGAGFEWILLSRLDSKRLTEKTRVDLNYFIESKNIHF